MVVTYGPYDSRCLYAVNAPQPLHWAVIGGDAELVGRELAGVIKASVPPQAWVDALADVDAVIERFERCLAVEPDDVKAVMMHDAIWEMRIDIEAHALIIRIYETEIDDLPGNIVALRVHRKVIFPGEPLRTKGHQDANIRIASDRWAKGRTAFWGL